MHLEDLSSSAEDQFSIEASDFIIESVPDTGIKLLRPRAECEGSLARQLDIPRRLELLRRCADPPSASSGAEQRTSLQHSPNRPPHTSPSPPSPTPSLEDEPESDSGPSADAVFLQDVQAVGETSRGETVHLVLSVLVEPSRWQGGWFIAVVPTHESERFEAYLASAREMIVAQLQHQP
jgi:hypothetical protein